MADYKDLNLRGIGSFVIVNASKVTNI